MTDIAIQARNRQQAERIIATNLGSHGDPATLKRLIADLLRDGSRTEKKGLKDALQVAGINEVSGLPDVSRLIEAKGMDEALKIAGIKIKPSPQK